MRRTGLALAILAGASVLPNMAIAGSSGTDCESGSAEQRAFCRADATVRSLGSVERKLAVAKDGLKALRLPDPSPADGPAGLRSDGPTTALPSPIAVAASFDPAIAALHGAVIGAEARAAHKTTVYGPAMDVLRVWRSGRVAESYGEDPFLAAEMAVAEVQGIQSHHVIATIKHFAAYTQEAGRLGDSPVGTRPSVNELISERVLREIYYPPFEAAVTRGGAGGVMCAFPRLNGTFACENAGLLNTLKQEWGFDGAVVPDFPSAQRSVVAAVNAGLDVGTFYPAAAFPGAPAVTPGGDIDLSTAVRQGKVSEARLDDLLRRRLVPGFRLGVYDPEPAVVNAAEHHADAVRIAVASAVLLKNRDHLLPLGSVRRIAVIGAQAGERPVVTEGGSANVTAHAAGIGWEAIVARAGSNTSVRYEAGTPPLGDPPLAPATAFRTVDGRPGLLATYVNNPRRDFQGAAYAHRVEPGVALDAAPAIAGLAADNAWSARWSGSFVPPVGGLQRLTLSGSGSGRLLIDGKIVAEFERADFGTRASASLDLVAGRAVSIAVEWTPREAAPMPRTEMFGTAIGTSIRLGWVPVGDGIARAAASAATSDVAVVFVAKDSSEGADQMTLSLPAEQDALIHAVAAANPRTVVVAAAGGVFAMPWRDEVGAILDLWYPGDGFSEAAAALLFGAAAPGGRLPVTFPADERQGPGVAPATYPGNLAADGSIGTVRFEEGLAVGYRYYQAHRQSPLFPFGYGLTYAPLTLGKARFSQSADQVHVAVEVRNPGTTPDSAVVQLYVTQPPESGEPARALAGFAKVPVAPGATTTGEVLLPIRAFQHWDERSHRWASTPGDYVLDVGTSSQDFMSRRIAHVSATGTVTLK